MASILLPSGFGIGSANRGKQPGYIGNALGTGRGIGTSSKKKPQEEPSGGYRISPEILNLSNSGANYSDPFGRVSTNTPGYLGGVSIPSDLRLAAGGDSMLSKIDLGSSGYWMSGGGGPSGYFGGRPISKKEWEASLGKPDTSAKVEKTEGVRTSGKQETKSRTFRSKAEAKFLKGSDTGYQDPKSLGVKK